MAVGLIPDSYEIIKSALSSHGRSYCRELQFSLFCYLDEVQNYAPLSVCKQKVLKLIFDYVVNVKSNQASAAWMAGDLLGDHWDLNEAIKVVRQASKIARHQAGKEALVHATAQLGIEIENCNEQGGEVD